MKLYTSFQSHWWFQTGVTVRKRSIWDKISDFFCPLWPWNLTLTLKSNRSPLLNYLKLCASFQSHRWTETEVTVRKRLIGVKIGDFFIPCDLEIWQTTLKNNRAPLLCYLKICASFHCHLCIQIGVTVRKRPIWVEIGNFFVPCDLEIWRMTFFYATLSFVHHFIATGEFKLKLESRKVQFDPNWAFPDRNSSLNSLMPLK